MGGIDESVRIAFPRIIVSAPTNACNSGGSVNNAFGPVEC